MAEEMFGEITVDGETLKIPYWLDFKDTDKLSPDTIKTAIKAVEEWDRVFGYPWRLEIRGIDKAVEHRQGIGEITLLENAHHGYIGLSDHPGAFNTVLHAMTHAYRPNNQETLFSPLQSDRGEIFGFLGLFIGYKLADGKTRTFKLLEESVAERNAVVVNPHYFPPNGEYYSTCLLTMVNFPLKGNKDPQDLVMTNDVASFVRRVLRIPIEKPITADDIFLVMDLYNEIALRSKEFNNPYDLKVAFDNKTLIPNLADLTKAKEHWDYLE